MTVIAHKQRNLKMPMIIPLDTTEQNILINQMKLCLGFA